jgi:diguanylate cyclase (GGDEF)-like protein
MALLKLPIVVGLSLILCDIDYFKNYNDHYGHQAGDACLRRVARVISETLHRPADLVARYGGEEFAIILPNTPSEGAVHIARLLQIQLKKLEISHAQSRVSSQVTVSLGISSQIPTPSMETHAFIAITDKALYLAKAEGRNTFRQQALTDLEST